MDAQKVGKTLVYLVLVAFGLDFLLLLHDDRRALLIIGDLHLVLDLEVFHLHLLAGGLIAAAQARLLLFALALLLPFIPLYLFLRFLLYFL